MATKLKIRNYAFYGVIKTFEYTYCYTLQQFIIVYHVTIYDVENRIIQYNTFNILYTYTLGFRVSLLIV